MSRLAIPVKARTLYATGDVKLRVEVVLLLRNGSGNFVHLADLSNNSDDSFTPGQKQDTVCPDTTAHGNPNKDDFTDVAGWTPVGGSCSTTTAGVSTATPSRSSKFPAIMIRCFSSLRSGCWLPAR